MKQNLWTKTFSYEYVWRLDLTTETDEDKRYNKTSSSASVATFVENCLFNYTEDLFSAIAMLNRCITIWPLHYSATDMAEYWLDFLCNKIVFEMPNLG